MVAWLASLARLQQAKLASWPGSMETEESAVSSWPGLSKPKALQRHVSHHLSCVYLFLLPRPRACGARRARAAVWCRASAPVTGRRRPRTSSGAQISSPSLSTPRDPRLLLYARLGARPSPLRFLTPIVAIANRSSRTARGPRHQRGGWQSSPASAVSSAPPRVWPPLPVSPPIHCLLSSISGC